MKTISGLFLLLSSAPALLIAMACGDGDKNKPAAAVPAPSASASVSTLTVQSTTGCAIDSDCVSGRYCFQNRCAYECAADTDCTGGAVCSARGRCVIVSNDQPSAATGASAADSGPSDTTDAGTAANDGTPVLTDVAVDNSVPSPPSGKLTIKKGATQAIYSLTLAKPVEGPVAYTLTRSDVAEWDGKVYSVSASGTQVNIPIPVGKADPGADSPMVVRISIGTPFGTFNISLVPEAPIEGTYAGQAAIAAFGDVGLPISFQIATNPPGAVLDKNDTTSAWLVFNVSADNLFSPIDASPSAPTMVAAPLSYDAFTQSWVAKFDYQFNLPSDSRIGSATPGQVGRGLRLQIQPLEGGQLTGKLTDSWVGLYDARSEQGILQPATTAFDATLTMKRVGAGVAAANIPPAPSILPANPTVQSAPTVNACTTSSVFPTTDQVVGTNTYSCNGITNGTTFVAASADAQASCALAAANVAMQGNTVGAAIRTYLSGTVPAGGKSFSDFMKDCATHANNTCVASPAITCARQLLARAHYSEDASSPTAETLIKSYADVTQEAFLGQLLAAFKNDSDTRLAWLKTTDYPAVVLTAVTTLVDKLMSDWRAGVLDPQLAVLNQYFDVGELAVMSRAVVGADAVDARNRLLGQAVQAWRGYSDSLQLATDRWNELYQDLPSRTQKAALVRARMFDLYLMAGVLKNLTATAGSGYQASAFGTGFAHMVAGAKELGMGFDDLVFARDAEVVVSTSLDATDPAKSTKGGILTQLKATADAAITQSQTSVASVLAAADAEALNETQLRDRMNNDLNSLREDLVNLCGLPTGCTADDFRTRQDCAVNVKAGACGFTVDKAGTVQGIAADGQNASEAGQAVLTILDANEAVKIARLEVTALANKAQLEAADNDAYAAMLADLDGKREEQYDALVATLAKVKNVTVSDPSNDKLREKVQKAKDIAEGKKKAAVAWGAIRSAATATSMGLEIAALAKDRLAATANEQADHALELGRAEADSLPRSAGTSNDVTAGARAAFYVTADETATLFREGAHALETWSKGLELAAAQTKEAAESSLETAEQFNEADEAIETAEQGDLDVEIAQAQRDTSVSIQDAKDAQSELDQLTANYIESKKEHSELATRQMKTKQSLEDLAGLQEKVERAKVNLTQRSAEYQAVVQKAQLLNSRLADLSAQRDNVNQLVGSPGVVFSRANRLAQAENRLDLAKDALMNWLVALEYYAVRPFVDQRVLILLARNPYQLEAISDELARLQSACGGAVNNASAELSLRDDLLRLNVAATDPITGVTMTPADRLRAVLKRGDVPIDKRVRYASDTSVGDLMKNPGRVLSATFTIDLDNFANLATTCNAKVADVSVELVGELGSAHPTVTILYDGTSKLRSCQPNIVNLVNTIGAERTAFGLVSRFRTPGRAISPVASLNAWDTSANSNITLGGLPLASQYTVLIDTQIGENARLNWSKLEDIKLKVGYVYSDLFPAGQCQ